MPDSYQPLWLPGTPLGTSVELNALCVVLHLHPGPGCKWPALQHYYVDPRAPTRATRLLQRPPPRFRTATADVLMASVALETTMPTNELPMSFKQSTSTSASKCTSEASTSGTPTLPRAPRPFKALAFTPFCRASALPARWRGPSWAGEHSVETKRPPASRTKPELCTRALHKARCSPRSPGGPA